MLRHYLILQFTSLIILNQSLYLTCTLFILGPKYIKGIKAAFENNASNGRLEGTNRRIKQIGRTAYGYANSMNYFYRIRIQLHNKFVLKQQFLTFKV
ncbi:transposase [Paucilactobacillus nenjiangensis]|uniref:transposase n=1 Tax=Paucilactobacillus nenjiangensis TaxID=1296540 RepID=UPI0016819145|nr:transposase [Paucilactobacillus nenjiangensis]